MNGVTRNVEFTVSTPVQGLGTVVCYADTMVQFTGTVVFGADISTIAIHTLEHPDVVVSGTSTPGYLAFVNRGYTSPSGSPFVVFVDPEGKPTPAVADMRYRKDFGQFHHSSVIWLPPVPKS